MTLQRKLLILGLFCITLGLAGVTPLAYFSMQNKVALAQPTKAVKVPQVAPQPVPAPSTISGKPVRLHIPSLAMNLTVADGVYNPKSGSWTLSRDKVHYALPSALANNASGNTLIYGHYRREVFARLHTITAGATAEVDTENGYHFTYTYRSTEAVQPNDTSIFAYTGKPRLTLQTCSGAFMQNRQLFYFDLSGYKKL